MANLLLQVTISRTNTPQQISASLPASIPPNTYFQQIVFQNNGSNNMRIGDVSVSSTKGIILTPGGSDTSTCSMNYGTYLSDWWVNGTAGDVLDILYIK